MTKEKTIRKGNTEYREVDFEHQYIQLRRKEGRLYTDDEVARLPLMASSGPNKKEWSIRRASCKRLVRYLKRMKRSLKILEVGTGNGWLSSQLAKIKYSNVVGLDINLLELNQAARVFARQRNLGFIYGDLRSEFLDLEKFDIIVFSASIQYFESFSEILNTAIDHLHEGGEVHITDTIFYPAGEVEEARKRSEDYFREIGNAGMKHFYFHRSLAELEEFNFCILHNPASVLNKILKTNSFYWICIKPAA